MSVISVETAQFLPRMMPVLAVSAPILRLNEDTAVRLLMTAAQIEGREALNPKEDVFRQMNDRLADLLRLQIILEVMYEIAEMHVYKITDFKS